jgi:hypothetical protein
MEEIAGFLLRVAMLAPVAVAAEELAAEAG